jgi:hypothetical protein
VHVRALSHVGVHAALEECQGLGAAEQSRITRRARLHSMRSRSDLCADLSAQTTACVPGMRASSGRVHPPDIQACACAQEHASAAAGACLSTSL